MNVLLCAPYRISTHPALLARWQTNARAEQARHAEHNVDVCLLPDSGAAGPGDGRYSAHARARNSLLDAVPLGAYDYLFWVDADLIQWPRGLLRWALKENPDGVSAPAVVVQYHPSWFFDWLGFVEIGREPRERREPPWFDQAGAIVELASVGSCYAIPASVYRDGARYAHTEGRTEHESVMASCRTAGRRICANLELVAVHAWRPNYGEPLIRSGDVPV